MKKHTNFYNEVEHSKSPSAWVELLEIALLVIAVFYVAPRLVMWINGLLF